MMPICIVIVVLEIDVVRSAVPFGTPVANESVIIIFILQLAVHRCRPILMVVVVIRLQ